MPRSHVHILVLSGPTGVGKSTLSWEISAQLRQVGIAHVVLDSDELDRVWPLSAAERQALNQANLSAFWASASALGNSRLILAGVFLNFDADRAWIDPAIPDALVTRIVLDASDDELEQRVRAREIGSGTDDQLSRTLTQARLSRRRNSGSPDVLNTTGTAVADIASQAIQRAGWTADQQIDPLPQRAGLSSAHANRGKMLRALSRSTACSSAAEKPSKLVRLAILRTTVGSGAAGQSVPNRM
jgi:AAA domain